MQDKSASSLIKRGDGGEADLDNEDTSVDIFMLKQSLDDSTLLFWRP